jgi:thiol:disulfide interchange protein DsbD
MRIRLFGLLMPLCMLLAASAAWAKPWWMRGIESNETDFLPPDVAFRVGATVDGNVIRVRWVIADGYYLYRHKMAVAAESPDLLVAGLVLPRGVPRTDRFLGNQEVFLQQVEGTVPFKRFDFGAHPLEIKVTYQGCAEAGLCYPPITRVLFPEAPPGGMPQAAASHGWEGIAIAGGAAAFLVAGLMLRKGRRLDPPPP